MLLMRSSSQSTLLDAAEAKALRQEHTFEPETKDRTCPGAADETPLLRQLKSYRPASGLVNCGNGACLLRVRIIGGCLGHVAFHVGQRLRRLQGTRPRSDELPRHIRHVPVALLWNLLRACAAGGS